MNRADAHNFGSDASAASVQRRACALTSVTTVGATFDQTSDRRREARLTVAREKRLVPECFNDTTHDFPSDKCLPDLLRAKAQEQPESTAVVHGDGSLTYRELLRRSEELALHLRQLGIAVEDRVGVFVEPSLDLIVGVWGILFSGAAYLPLSPEYPEERLRFMIEDCRVGVIFSQEHLKAGLAELAPEGTRIVTLNDAPEHTTLATLSDKRALQTGLRPDNLAYIIYTSGSTGKPKGVMIEHRSVVNQMHWLHAAYGLDQHSVVLQKTPMSFDAAQWEILAPSCGSRVVMGSTGVFRDPEGLVATIARHGVTTLQCVPTLLQALLDTEELHECTTLRQIFSGGEALSKPLAIGCIEALPACTLVNLYGPTECTINTSAFTVDPRTVHDGADAIAIGAPVHNTRYYILDEHRSPVGVGEVGELYIGGVQLARGYVQRPDLTAERFIDHPLGAQHGCQRLYRTGDLAYWYVDGTVGFAGRTDNQVKLRGFRIELDEIKHAVETHDWVKRAGVVVRDDARTGFQNLIAFIELNPREAALMDQGNHGAHHQSKNGRLQAKAQLSNPGCRDVDEIAGKSVVELPGSEPNDAQRREVFARKTYRFFEGGEVTKGDILRLLRRQVVSTRSRGLDALGLAELGVILRYFGQYVSPERLLPKYGYASPGALYATQMYLELHGIGGLAPGYYYYHPVLHQLILIGEADRSGQAPAPAQVKIHFVGKKRAIAPVYKNNIQEVLEIEVGHMVGLFEKVLPKYGVNIRALEYAPSTKRHLQCADEDYYLGTFELLPCALTFPDGECDIYVQSHPGMIADLPAGQYHYTNGDLVRISDDLLLQKHVVAINQQVYERASFGVTAVSTSRVDWLRYIDLGRMLQHLMMNDMNLGFMSSGYSSKSGDDLPSAKRIESILAATDRPAGPSYFFVGGRVSDEQVRSQAMKEDAVHMKGPTELIRDDLMNFLPDYMMPNKVVVLDELPLTANGKICAQTLQRVAETELGIVDRPQVAARTLTERRIAAIWKAALKHETVSVTDDFFESGGNSLIAVGLVNKINRELRDCAEAQAGPLPVQALFEAPTIERLAARLDADGARRSPRLVRLHADGSQSPIYCWPGLGGYPLNLRVLARSVGVDRPFYGVQAHGINHDEIPYATIGEMAAEDIKLIRRRQPHGPYTLWGYSFGARMAFEVAYQLEQSGEQVENVLLIAPGSPKVRARDASSYESGEPSYANQAYVTILFSVFAGSITHPALEECLAVARDEESFANFVSSRLEIRDVALVKRILRIVYATSQLRYTIEELADKQLSASITICKARGDDDSFIEHSRAYARAAPTVIDLQADHYSLLTEPHVDELVMLIRSRLRTQSARATCRHRAARDDRHGQRPMVKAA